MCLLCLYSASVEAIHPHMSLLTHTHFVNYGGGYYSYLLAKMYAAQIYHRHFKNNNSNDKSSSSSSSSSSTYLSRDSGLYIWRNMFAYGASKDPSEILFDVAGDLDPTFYIDSILKKKRWVMIGDDDMCYWMDGLIDWLIELINCLIVW